VLKSCCTKDRDFFPLSGSEGVGSGNVVWLRFIVLMIGIS
jgi:hypothetical protein